MALYGGLPLFGDIEMTNKVSDGKTIQYTNTGSAIVSGQCVPYGNLATFAVTDIAATTGVGALEVANGIYTVTAATGAWTVGQPLYMVSDGSFTTASTGNTACGFAAAAKTTAATTGNVIFARGN